MGQVSNMVAFWNQKVKENRVSDEILYYFDIIWTHRKNILSKKHSVYGLYNRAPHYHRTKASLTDTKVFLTELYTGLGNPSSMQVGRYAGFLVKSLGLKLGDLIFIINQPDKLVGHDLFDTHKDLRQFGQNQNMVETFGTYLLEDLSSAFFHFSRIKMSSTWRIYLRPKTQHAIKVHRHMVKNIVRDAKNHPGAINAKIAGPGPQRADTIVMYMKDRASMEKALDAIAEYQKKQMYLNYFEFGGTRGTQIIRQRKGVQMRGVAIGASPPNMKVSLSTNKKQFKLKKGSTSFGSFRALLITMALEETCKTSQDNNLKQDFIDLACRYMETLGIDLSNPSEQSMKLELEDLARRSKRVDVLQPDPDLVEEEN